MKSINLTDDLELAVIGDVLCCVEISHDNLQSIGILGRQFMQLVKAQPDFTFLQLMLVMLVCKMIGFKVIGKFVMYHLLRSLPHIQQRIWKSSRVHCQCLCAAGTRWVLRNDDDPE